MLKIYVCEPMLTVFLARWKLVSVLIKGQITVIVICFLASSEYLK